MPIPEVAVSLCSQYQIRFFNLKTYETKLNSNSNSTQQSKTELLVLPTISFSALLSKPLSSPPTPLYLPYLTSRPTTKMSMFQEFQGSIFIVEIICFMLLLFPSVSQKTPRKSSFSPIIPRAPWLLRRSVEPSSIAATARSPT